MIISMNIKELIESFIKAIKNEYPSLIIGYDFDDEMDQYDIWHIDSNLEFSDKNFKSFVAEKAREYLFNNNIYNFSFGYDHYKYKKLNNVNKFRIELQNINLHLKASQKLLNTGVTNVYSYGVNIDMNTTGHIKIKEVNEQVKQDYEKILNSTFKSGITYRDNEFREAS